MPINLSGFGFNLCEQKQYCNTLWLIASNWGNHNLYVRFLLALWTLNFLHRPYFILFMRTPPLLALLACLSQETKYLKIFENALCSGLPFFCIHKQSFTWWPRGKMIKDVFTNTKCGHIWANWDPSYALSDSRDTMKDQA